HGPASVSLPTTRVSELVAQLREVEPADRIVRVDVAVLVALGLDVRRLFIGEVVDTEVEPHALAEEFLEVVAEPQIEGPVAIYREGDACRHVIHAGQERSGDAGRECAKLPVEREVRSPIRKQ